MVKIQERDLPLRCVLRMQKKSQEADKYIADCLPVWEKAVADGKLLSGTVFTLEDQIFVYYECTVPFCIEEYLPKIGEYVYLWPGQAKPRPYIPMVKLYQSIPMEEVRDWKRKKPVTPYLRVSRMDIDKLQSYIFYHYQLQEEEPGHNGRYLGIWDSEDWCVLYNEENSERPIDTDYQGKLSTHDCPISQWHEYMTPHFIFWPDGEKYHDADILLHVQAYV